MTAARPLAVRDWIPALEQPSFPRGSRPCAAPVHPELHWGSVFAQKLIENNQKPGNHIAVRELHWDRIE